MDVKYPQILPRLEPFDLLLLRFIYACGIGAGNFFFTIISVAPQRVLGRSHQMDIGFMNWPFPRKVFKTTLLPFTEHEKYGLLCVTLPLRLVRRFSKAMHLCAVDGDQISKAHLGPLVGSN
jgi:hypothetical protein